MTQIHNSKVNFAVKKFKEIQSTEIGIVPSLLFEFMKKIKIMKKRRKKIPLNQQKIIVFFNLF
jgi:hypothetical protein